MPATSEQRKGNDLTETEREALHEVELGIERMHRAHGHLVAFHHNVVEARTTLPIPKPLSAS